MICSLCKLEKAPRKNTHYLTDSIIRTALNEDGVNERDKGIYFEINPDNLFSEMKFQRGASPEKLEELLGRATNDEENQQSRRKIEFSVNDKFCKECEDKFGLIEVNFNEKILKYYREQKFSTEIDYIKFDVNESKIVRLFFLMQFWRTSICNDTFTILPDVTEFLRTKILNLEYEDLECIPLSVTYLETLPDEEDINVVTREPFNELYKGTNHVSVVEGSNPYIILMNDFVIQMYDTNRLIFESFYGLNQVGTFAIFFNHNKDEFMSPIFLNNKRKEFINAFTKPVAKLKIAQSVEFICLQFEQKFGTKPDLNTIAKYMDELANVKQTNKFSVEQLTKFTNDFLEKLY